MQMHGFNYMYVCTYMQMHSFNYICMYAQSPVLGSVVIEYNKQLVLSHKRLGIGTTVQVSK